MVVIRLSRGGTNKRPFYKVVAADRRAPRDGCYLEQLGYFNPIAMGGEKRLEIVKERLDYWLGQGAQPSERVTSLLRELDKPEIVEKRRAKNAARKTRKKAKANIEQKSEATAVESTEKEASEETAE